MVNGTLRARRKRMLLSKFAANPRRNAVSLSICAAGNSDRGVGFCPGAAHVETAVAGRDVVAADNAHSVEAAGRALPHVVFWQREDDRGGAGDEFDKRWRRLTAVGFGE